VGTRFSARPDRPWGPPNLLQNGYRVFPGGKVRSGRAAYHSLPSSAAVMEDPPSGPHRACNGITLIFLFIQSLIHLSIPAFIHSFPVPFFPKLYFVVRFKKFLSQNNNYVLEPCNTIYLRWRKSNKKEKQLNRVGQREGKINRPGVRW